MSHNDIITHILEAAITGGVYRLHTDIIPEDLEQGYSQRTGKELAKKKLSGGHQYRVDDTMFYYGHIINHPSLKNRPIIAA